MDNYQNLSIDYDALQPKEEIFKQEPFFRKLIEKYSIKTCLDCACGTGWHLHMLNNLGIKCAGSDLSEDMLEKAKKNLEDLPIELKKETFRTLSKSWDQKFDMVICMTTSFPHNSNENEAIQTLKSMYDRLNDGGIIVIDNGFADSFFETKPKFIPARIHKDQAFYFFLEYPNPKKVIFNILNIKKTKTSFEHALETMEYLYLGKEEFEDFFAKTDFDKIEYYGGYNFTRYSKENSKRIVLIAQK